MGKNRGIALIIIIVGVLANNFVYLQDLWFGQVDEVVGYNLHRDGFPQFAQGLLGFCGRATSIRLQFYDPPLPMLS